MKKKEFLALFLAMVSEEGWDRFRREFLEHPEAVNHLNSIWNRAEGLISHDVYTYLRNGLDLSYHGMRAWWERPSFRSSLANHENIEMYRKLVAFHLNARIMDDVPWVKKTIQSPARWRNVVSKVATIVLRTGDIVLDGILAILLDVLKGNGKGVAISGTLDSCSLSISKESTSPNLENLLDELSDSDYSKDLRLCPATKGTLAASVGRIHGGETGSNIEVASVNPLAKIRDVIFPIYGNQEVTKFLLIGSIKFFIIMALTLTRDTKDTMVVTQCGAEAIAFLKVSSLYLKA
ncbi:MAG: hypothetical protein SGBAC_003083 [Bacillariaceae sp.]